MKIVNSKKFLLGLLILILIGILLFLLSFGSKNNWQKKTLLYSFSLQNTSHAMLPNVQFDVVLPKNIKGIQKIVKDETVEDKSQLENVKQLTAKIPPYGSKMISFTLEIEKNNKPHSVSIKEEEYLQSGKYIQIDDPSIQTLAKRLKAETTDLTIKNIYNWLINNVKSENYMPENKGAISTLQSLSGDCTEVTYLFVALARANGIPARGVRGLYVPQPSIVVGPMDYHDWAEFYDGDQWVIADAQKQIFNSDYANFLHITDISEINNNSKRFSVSNDSISVSFQ